MRLLTQRSSALEQKRSLDAQIAELRAMLSPGSNGSAGSTSPAEPAVREKQGMSAAGRKAIAEAQRKRWAAVKGQSIEPVAAKRPKRKLVRRAEQQSWQP